MLRAPNPNLRNDNPLLPEDCALRFSDDKTKIIINIFFISFLELTLELEQKLEPLFPAQEESSSSRKSDLKDNINT
jgi:hypothetical protein